MTPKKIIAILVTEHPANIIRCTLFPFPVEELGVKPSGCLLPVGVFNPVMLYLNYLVPGI